MTAHAVTSQLDAQVSEPAAAQPSPGTSIFVNVAIVGWVAAVIIGSLFILQYTQSPGPEADSPRSWPVASPLARDSGLPTLVMFVHPQCPCSRASVAELERLMARFHGRLHSDVVFFIPEGAGEDWLTTDLWSQAAVIPGVTLWRDDAGREARRFQIETSGQTVFYDAGGTLRFQGGLTASRGHEGDSPGGDAVAALLDPAHERAQAGDVLKAPVFGCTLFDSLNSRGGLQ